MAAPIITRITPTSGVGSGGAIVTLTGTGFTGAVAVGFGPWDSTNIAVVSDTQVIAVSPPGAGSLAVTVVTPSGRSAIDPAIRFTYAAPRPMASGSPFDIDPPLAKARCGIA